MFTPGVPEDEKLHQNVHDVAVNGIRFPGAPCHVASRQVRLSDITRIGWKNERIVASFGSSERIVEVQSGDESSHRATVRRHLAARAAHSQSSRRWPVFCAWSTTSCSTPTLGAVVFQAVARYGEHLCRASGCSLFRADVCVCKLQQTCGGMRRRRGGHRRIPGPSRWCSQRSGFCEQHGRPCARVRGHQPHLGPSESSPTRCCAPSVGCRAVCECLDAFVSVLTTHTRAAVPRFYSGTQFPWTGWHSLSRRRWAANWRKGTRIIRRSLCTRRPAGVSSPHHRSTRTLLMVDDALLSSCVVSSAVDDDTDTRAHIHTW
jgi:hypothetical protein